MTSGYLGVECILLSASFNVHFFYVGPKVGDYRIIYTHEPQKGGCLHTRRSGEDSSVTSSPVHK